MSSDAGIVLPPIQPEIVESPEDKLRRELIDERAKKLGFLRYWWYRFLFFWRLGNTRHIYNALWWDGQAARRETIERQLERQLTPEAKVFARLLQHRLAMLGHSDIERVEGRRRIRHMVRFQTPVYMTSEAFYYRVLTTRRGLFGSKSMLPYKSSITKIIDEETLRDLSITVNRVVTAEWRPHKGLWLIVWRLRDYSGLPNLVRFSDMLQFFTPGQAEICLGVSEHRKVQMIRLSKVPHALIAGETGGGKSVTMNNIICGLIRHNTPQELKIALIDLKGGVEFLDYEDIPHLVGPILTSQGQALKLLKQALALIKQRYALMAKRARSLDEFNRRLPEEKRIPRLVIMIDELAEILTGAKRRSTEIETLLLRICQLGRAAGVHVVAATQRPSKEIVSPAIAANMPLKVSHKMGRPTDSLTILGTGDAADLEDVPGRAVYKISWQVIKIHPPFITFPNIAESVAIAKEFEQYELELPDVSLAEAINADDGPAFNDEQALITILEKANGRLTIHTIQNVLDIPRWQAGLFQERVAGLIFEHDGQQYQVVRYNKSVRIVPLSSNGNGNEKAALRWKG